MVTKRTYGEACGTAHALDLVGERWALLVVRELLLGPKRFTDLRAGIAHASPNVLSQRLHELESAGVVEHRKLGPPSGAQVYELTEWGEELEPVITALGRWGVRSSQRPLDAPTSIDSHILAMRCLFDPDAAADLEASYELRIGDDRFVIEVADGTFEAARGSADDPTATIATDPDTLGDLLWEGRKLSAALRSGAVTIEGERSEVERLLALFPLPDRVAAAA